ncbi:hypothetical protein GCM10010967_56780 [Dyadobacter beijingensis]|uniref:Uncharacterized protein n=1 Tax=Dyadobacter beijingensis TaxID=365489 RepID=A0ABQ2IIT5_9BACT|nr:DUF5908 family protein [Dyadobacter beijingensis]GGN13315.1 hypothetical protein GCM10010967_56780 [Dyadobacter beijingensis]
MIEIKELVVRANITETPIDPASPPRQDARNSTREGLNEEVIQACVRQVMDILKRQKER